MTKLGSICSFQSGGTPAKGKQEYFNGSIPWITTTALNGTQIDEKDAVDWITERAINETAAKIVPAYSIMVGTRVGVGKVAINTVDMSTSQDVISLLNIDEKNWSKEYICKFIQGKSSYLNSQARGATIKGIKIEVLSNLEVPTVDFKQQRFISETLDRVSSVISARKQELQKLDDLIKARFVEIFGDCRLNPKGWNTVALGDIAEVGSSKRVFVEELKEIGIPFYRGTEVGALAEGKTVKPELFITENHYNELINATGKPELGDLLMPSICPDGRIWVVDTDKPFYFKDGRVLWVHKIDKKFDPVFLLYTLKDRIMADYGSIASGTTFAELKIFALKQCQVFDVPIADQRSFATFIAQIDKSKAVIQKSLEEAQLLFDSLMQQYFG